MRSYQEVFIDSLESRTKVLGEAAHELINLLESYVAPKPDAPRLDRDTVIAKLEELKAKVR